MTSGIGVEEEVAATWLYSTLHADAPLLAAAPGDVWDGPTPGGTARPHVLFTLQSSITVRGVGFTEIMVNMLWVVRAVNEGSTYAPMATAAARIQSLLHGVQDAVVPDPSGVIVTSAREQTFRQAGEQGGREFRALGGIYRIYVQGS